MVELGKKIESFELLIKESFGFIGANNGSISLEMALEIYQFYF